MTLPDKGSDGTDYFGGRHAVGEALYRHVVEALFQKDFRSGESFYAHAKSLEGSILSYGMALKDQTILVLNAYDRTRTVLHTLENAGKTNKEIISLCGLIREDLDTLVPKNFLALYPLDRLAQLPRYLKGMEIRAVRGANDPEKDKKKQAEAELFIQSYREMVKELLPHASPEKGVAVDAYRWMVEEFKISVFAQELKTQFPISKKRLEEKKAEIERMV